MKRNVVVFFLVILSIQLLRAQESCYGAANVLKFADNLYATKDYERAIGEYLRAISLGEGNVTSDALYFRIALSYIGLSQPEKARKFCLKLTRDSTVQEFYSRAICLTAYSYYVEKRYGQALSYIAEKESLLEGAEWKVRLNQIKVAGLLKQHDWSDAQKLCSASDEQAGSLTNDSLYRHLCLLSKQGEALQGKSPFVAAALSTIIPGSGKIYAHRAMDGVFSLMIVAAMGWQSYDGFNASGITSGRGIIFGMLAASFYTGNIYGSMNAARNYNAAKKNAVAQRAILDFSW